MSSDFEQRLIAIELRNRRVEYDKAWEVSWVRRGLIAAITYICAGFLMTSLGGGEPWLNAVVPVMGYLLSTLSLPFVKVVWLKLHSKNMTASPSCCDGNLCHKDETT